MADSLIPIFGETLAPAIEKMRTNKRDCFKIDLNGFTWEEVNQVAEKLCVNEDNLSKIDQADLDRFSLLRGAKAIQDEFHPKKQAKLSDIRDYYILGLARDRVQGGQRTSYHTTIYFHEYGEILSGKWNKFANNDLMINSEKIKIYNQYTRNTYNAVVKDSKEFEKVMPSKEEIGQMSMKEKSKSLDESFEKRHDFFSVPKACYKKLSLHDMLDYAGYLIVEGDLETYLQDESPTIQKFNDMLKNGESFNIFDLRKAWWIEEEIRAANEVRDPNIIYIGSSRSIDKSQPK